MAKDSPFDLFQSGAKKNKGTGTPDKATPSPAVSSANTRNIAVEAMIERMNSMRQELENKIEDAATKHGISKEKLHAFLNDPKNFTPEQWEFLKQTNKDFAQKIWATVNNIGTATTSSPTDRKGKFIGPRRKWIPAR